MVCSDGFQMFNIDMENVAYAVYFEIHENSIHEAEAESSILFAFCETSFIFIIANDAISLNIWGNSKV